MGAYVYSVKQVAFRRGDMRTIELAVEILTVEEGFREQPYYCSEGYPTVGIGRELQNFGLSNDEARYLLMNDIQRVLKEAEAFEWWNHLNEPRKICVANMLFNLGLTRFNKFKKFQAALNTKSWSIAADEMMDSRWAKQVKTRALRLEKIMRTGQLL